MPMIPRSFAIAACLTVLAAAPAAYADPSAADILVARQLGNEGIELAQKGDCEGALVKLDRAEAIHHAPTLLVRIGECQAKIGRLVDALSSFDRVVREKLPEASPRAFFTAQQRAATLIQEIKPKLGTLRLDTSGGPREGVAFRLDGAELKEASLGLERPIDPGSHVFEATTSDGRNVRKAVDVKQGGTELVTLELPAAMAPAPRTDAPPPSTHPNENSGLRTIGWGLTIGGGAALVASAVFAGLTLSTKSSLDSACADKSCPSSSRSDYDSAKTTATLSGVALVVGVIAATAGVYILVTKKGERAAAISPWVRVATTGALAF
jgi:hypothetical protein